jgi:hypothetical protein
MPHYSAIFQLKLDYLEIFSWKLTIQNYTENALMKVALKQADRQTDKYEANWRLCDPANAHVTAEMKESQCKISVALNQWGEAANPVLFPSTRSP